MIQPAGFLCILLLNFGANLRLSIEEVALAQPALGVLAIKLIFAVFGVLSFKVFASARWCLWLEWRVRYFSREVFGGCSAAH